MKVGRTDCSETSEQKIHAPGNHPKKNTTFTKRQKISIKNSVQRQALVLAILGRSKKRMDKYSNIRLHFTTTYVVSERIKKKERTGKEEEGTKQIEDDSDQAKP